MTEFLPPFHLLVAFIGASLVLAVTPGPGVMYIVTRSSTQGRRAGLASVAGVAVGNLGGAAGAALGLAALLAASSTAFMLVKYAGAAYLIHLGIKALRNAPAPATEGLPVDHGVHRRAFRDGLVVALLNPKTTIFFAAFLPQFMTPGADPVVQGLSLGTLFVAVAALTDAVYAFAAGSFGERLRRHARIGRIGRRVSGFTYIGLGLYAALAGTRRGA